MSEKHPNLVFVFADQWRAQACGYAGDPNVRTPVLDRFAGESVNFTHAISGCPVCSPWRASFMTGQYPHRNGMVANDQCLAELASPGTTFLAEALAAAGYATAYVGKWHIDGHGRSAVVPRERRLGFDFWRGFECTHNYNDSFYYADDDPVKRRWEGYDAEAQTVEACRYIAARAGNSQPFALVLSWGPPHDPYDNAPERYRGMYDPAHIVLRPNVPPEEQPPRHYLAGYYAHCTALDACFGTVLETLDRSGLAGDTIVVFASDHGDMLGSHRMGCKQKPWEESVRVPLLVRDPRRGARGGCATPALINAPDYMPTLLGLCGAPIPPSVQGLDFSSVVLNDAPPPDEATMLSCYIPFHQWTRSNGGRECRGLRTARHTYMRDLDGPWLLYDNEADPYQMTSLVADPNLAGLREKLDAELTRRLEALGDDFAPADAYFERFHIRRDAGGDVFYAD